MNICIVYRIINTINNKVYFGVTKVGLNKRWIQHKCNSTRKSYHLYNAIRKYGFDAFKMELVKACDSEDEMYLLEKTLIREYKTNNPQYGYNNSTGGEKSTLGSKRTSEQRKRISEYQKKRIRHKYTEETILKMRMSAKGRNMSKAIESSANNRKGKPAKNIRPVYSVDKNNSIRYYNSISIAANETGILITAIANNLKGLTKTSGGLSWHYQQQN